VTRFLLVSTLAGFLSSMCTQAQAAERTVLLEHFTNFR